MGTRLAGNVTAGRDSQLVILGADLAVLDPAVATPPAGAAVAVGPFRDASSAVAALTDLVRAGGVVAAGGNVDLGDGFRSARLPGGTGDRRDGVAAALRVVPPERLGDRFAVLIALFGPSATKRVGAAALKAIHERRFAALTLAAGASDVLGPEQLERILALEGDPVGAVAPSIIAAHLSSVFPCVPAKRRADLLVSLWQQVAEHVEAERRISLRLAGQVRTPSEELRAQRRALEDELVVQRLQSVFNRTPTLADAARWVPDPGWMHYRFEALFVEALQATARLRAALAVAEYGVQAGIQLTLPLLKAANVGDICRRVRAGRVLSVEDSNLVVERLSRAYDDGVTVLDAASAWLVLAMSLAWDSSPYWDVHGLTEWRAVAGYSAVRPPESWIERPALSPLGTPALADRTPIVEQVSDLLWLVDLADVLAQMHGHERAVVDAFWSFEVDPPAEPIGPASPGDSVPAALAGAAQLVAFGATPPRTSDWSRFAAGLTADALVIETFTNTFAVPAVLAERDGVAIPGTAARLEVARNPRQLATWAQEMGNCIAGPEYVDWAQSGRCVLAALRAPDGRLLANVEIVPRGKARGWLVEQMRARFNSDPSPELASRFTEWVGSLPRPALVFADTRPDRPDRTRTRRTRRRPPRRPPLGGPLSAAATSALAAVEPSLELLESLVDDRKPLVGRAGAGGRLVDGAAVRRRLADGGPLVGPVRPGAHPVGRSAIGGSLDDAPVRRWLADGGSLAALWDASGVRPLTSAIDALDPALRSAWHHLERLTAGEPLTGSLLSLARRPPIAAARAAERAAARVRWSIRHLARADDPVLATAVRRTADRSALCGLLHATAGPPVRTVAVTGPEGEMVVPRSWLGRGGWPALWHESAKRHATASGK